VEIEEFKKNDALMKEKKKRKKKKILPKDLTKSVDSERWIPLKQRSYYKRKQRKNKLDKGAQGGVTVGRSVQLEKGKTADKPTEKTTTSSSNISPPNSPPTERDEKEEAKSSSATGSQNSKKKPKRKRR